MRELLTKVTRRTFNRAGVFASAGMLATVFAGGCGARSAIDDTGASGGATSGAAASSSMGSASSNSGVGGSDPSGSSGSSGSGGGGSGGGTSVGASSGSGGSGSGTSVGGSSGSGGSGGGPTGSCANLLVHEPFVGLAGGVGFHQRNPQLVTSASNGSTVTVMSAWETTDAPGTSPVALQHTTFSPWNVWPGGALLEPTYLFDEYAGGAFAAGRKEGDGLSLLFIDGAPGDPKNAYLTNALVPGAPTVPAAVVVDESVDRALVAVESFAALALVATERKQAQAGGDAYQLRAGYHYWNMVQPAEPVACAGAPLAADAVPESDYVLFALSNSTSYASPTCLSGTLAPPSRLQVVDVHPVLSDMLLHDIDAPGISDVRMARATSSLTLWVVWGTGDGAGHGTKIFALKAYGGNSIDLGIALPIPISFVSGSMAAAASEEWLFIAWIDSGTPGVIHVQTLDSEGQPGAGTEIFTGGAQGRLSMVGAVAGRSALLAWSESPGAGATDGRVQITRLDCVDVSP